MFQIYFAVLELEQPPLELDGPGPKVQLALKKDPSSGSGWPRQLTRALRRAHEPVVVKNGPSTQLFNNEINFKLRKSNYLSDCVRVDT